MSLDFLTLRKANRERCIKGFNHNLEDWSEMEWGCAAAGEMGELCNLLKKRKRGEDIPLKAVMDEIADTIIYLDLLAAHLGVHLSGPIREKFNETSIKRGVNIFLCLFLFLCSTLHAQDQKIPLPMKPYPIVNVRLTDGQRKWYEPLPVKNRTADWKYDFSTGLSLGSTIGDVENSVYALGKLPNASEKNFLYGAHPGRGRYYAISLPVASLAAYYSYKYKREDDALKANGLPGHRFIKWWLPNALNMAGHVVGIVYTLKNTGY